ncbi:hypothetical protein LIER_17938 [Lithospermum erythrorhizon]|uniref:Uncharacterized protein n=1 Tax=Lithospermum erythrorhizon TaxID=34254 RepID=A0AAV3QHQ9_LITER
MSRFSERCASLSDQDEADNDEAERREGSESESDINEEELNSVSNGLVDLKSPGGTDRGDPTDGENDPKK